jgi:hypothetical protein
MKSVVLTCIAVSTLLASASGRDFEVWKAEFQAAKEQAARKGDNPKVADEIFDTSREQTLAAAFAGITRRASEESTFHELTFKLRDFEKSNPDDPNLKSLLDQIRIESDKSAKIIEARLELVGALTMLTNLADPRAVRFIGPLLSLTAKDDGSEASPGVGPPQKRAAEALNLLAVRGVIPIKSGYKALELPELRAWWKVHHNDFGTVPVSLSSMASSGTSTPSKVNQPLSSSPPTPVPSTEPKHMESSPAVPPRSNIATILGGLAIVLLIPLAV